MSRNQITKSAARDAGQCQMFNPKKSELFGEGKRCADCGKMESEHNTTNASAPPAQTFTVGSAVIIDGAHFGEIIEDMMGGFYRVEVDAYPKHQFWTVAAHRMEESRNDSILKGGFIQTDILSDGSKCYDVHLPDQIINCRDEKSARKLIEQLNEAIRKYSI